MAVDGAHIKVDGLKETLDSFARCGVAARDMTRAMRPISRMLAKRARQIVPRREGYLRRSIRAKARKDRASAVAGGRMAWFAPVVHFGWRSHSIEPNHFMFMTLDEKGVEAEQMMLDAIRTLAREQGLHTDI